MSQPRVTRASLSLRQQTDRQACIKPDPTVIGGTSSCDLEALLCHGRVLDERSGHANDMIGR